MNRRSIWVGAAIAVVVALAFVIAVVTTRDDKSGSAGSTTTLSDPATVLAALASVSPGSIDAAASAKPPTPVAGAPIAVDGKPEVLYVGAEYCPFCAAERWPLYLALSRFGTFSGVGVTHSSSTDVYPDTPTLSFHGSTYTSDFLAFTPVELATNVPNGSGGYTALDALTPTQLQVVNQLSPGGGIPFVDIGGKYVIFGASYDPASLEGRSAADVAQSLSTGSGEPAASILGAAKSITTALCALTAQQPATACAALSAPQG
jgi:hypothetical protein